MSDAQDPGVGEAAAPPGPEVDVETLLEDELVGVVDGDEDEDEAAERVGIEAEVTDGAPVACRDVAGRAGGVPLPAHRAHPTGRHRRDGAPHRAGTRVRRLRSHAGKGRPLPYGVTLVTSS